MFGQVAIDQGSSPQSLAAAGFGVDFDFEAFGENDQGLLRQAAALFFRQLR
jgi:hypothetical protein